MGYARFASRKMDWNSLGRDYTTAETSANVRDSLQLFRDETAQAKSHLP